MVRREYCAVVFIDLKNAYECANIDKLVTVLVDLGLSHKMINIWMKLLRDNTFSITLTDGRKVTRHKSHGLIQGGILSPILFNLYMMSLGRKLTEIVRFVQFADDYAIYCASQSLPSIVSVIQLAIDNVYAWCVENSMTVAKNKFRVIVFSKKTLPVRNTNIDLTIDSHNVLQVQHTKFLGLTLDSRLNISVHVNKIKVRTIKLLSIMKAMVKTKFGSLPSVMLNFYRATIRSLFDYGSSFINMGLKSNSHTLDSLQARALKICLGALMTSSNNAILVEANESPLVLRRTILAAKMILKQTARYLLINKLEIPKHICPNSYIHKHDKLPAIIKAHPLIGDLKCILYKHILFPCFNISYEEQIQSCVMFSSENGEHEQKKN